MPPGGVIPNIHWYKPTPPRRASANVLFQSVAALRPTSGPTIDTETAVGNDQCHVCLATLRRHGSLRPHAAVPALQRHHVWFASSVGGCAQVPDVSRHSCTGKALAIQFYSSQSNTHSVVPSAPSARCRLSSTHHSLLPSVRTIAGPSLR